jgi:hypothetical protein
MGEPGIGKSRLVQKLKEQLAHAGVTCIEFHCSPYHQNSALYPIIEHLQRLLQFEREDSPATKLEKLQHALSRYHFLQADTVPLLAALLSLPHPESYPPLTVSPQKQQERTQAALVAWLLEETAQQPVCTTWEDVHWTDPSTLDVLHLMIDQVPTVHLYVLLTFRPEVTPPWGHRSHLSQLTLSRLGRAQVESMVEQVTGGNTLPLRGCRGASRSAPTDSPYNLQQGLDASQATGAEGDLTRFLAALAEMHGKVGQVAEGLHLLDEATAMMRKNENRSHEAELYRLRGELALQQWKGESQKLKVSNPQPLSSKRKWKRSMFFEGYRGRAHALL